MSKTNKASKKEAASEKLQKVIVNKTVESLTSEKTAKVKKDKVKTKDSAKKADEKVKKVKKVEKTDKAEKTEKVKKEKKEVAPREVKYNYPKDCTDALSKKKFRTQMRAKIASYEKALEKLDPKSKEGKAKAKEYKEFKEQYLRG